MMDFSSFNLPRTPSVYQGNIFEHIYEQFNQILGAPFHRENAVGIGVAGCGKTWTLVTGVNHFIPDTTKLLMVAYNASIAAELGKQLPNRIVKTYHALGLWAIRSSVQGVRVEDDTTGRKTTVLLKKYLDRQQWGKYFGAIDDMVSAIKNELLQDDLSDAALFDLALRKGHHTTIEDVWEVIFDAVRYVINESMNWTNFVDFDDMIWFPAIFDWIKVPQFDGILVDEVQDTNMPQRILIRKALRPHGFIMGIGDPAQSIYAWRGASSDAMEQFTNDFGAKTLPLTISYRAPLAIVARVNEKWPHIQFEAAPGAIEGSVNHTDLDKITFSPGDLVMCRTNAPLVPLAYRLIGQGIRAQIKSKDLSKGLRALIRQMNASDIPELLGNLVQYRDAETYKLRQAERPGLAQNLQDKVDTIIHLSARASTLEELDQQIGAIFTTKTAPVTLTTGHGAKGLEAQSTYILRPDLLPLSYAKTPVELQQEENLEYVINTRTKRDMTIILGE